MDEAPVVEVALNRFGVEVEESGGGVTVLRCPEPLDELPDHLVATFRERAERHPDRDMFCQRDGSGAWRRASWGEVRRAADAVAQTLVEGGDGRPVAILSDNSIEQAFVLLGAMTAGVPALPVSPAYSLMSRDHEKLRGVIAHHDPGVV